VLKVLSKLVHLSSGVSAPEEISDNLLRVKEKGEEACMQFRNRIKKGCNFYDPIKKIKIRTFSDIKIKQKK